MDCKTTTCSWDFLKVESPRRKKSHEARIQGNSTQLDLWKTMKRMSSAEGSRLTWRRLFEFMSTCGHLQGDFWSWVCSLEGRRSTATQWTHKEFAPKNAAAKVPVPWGRECHWETRRPKRWNRQRCYMRSCGSGRLALCNSKVMPWAFAKMPTERGSLSSCSPFASVYICRIEFSHKTWKLALEICRMVECRWNLHSFWACRTFEENMVDHVCVGFGNASLMGNCRWLNRMKF